jgi:hypothetical protein
MFYEIRVLISDVLPVERTARITVWPGSETFVKYTEDRCGDQFVSDHGRKPIDPKCIMVNLREVFVCDPSCVLQVCAAKQRWISVVVRDRVEGGHTPLCENKVEVWKHPFLIGVDE